ncbi:MAG: response regulator transcription factor [Verrucomicrobiales bacterium]|nr:response regulator transcription factor [Verrucomicrobiales bacterium]
MNPPRKIRILIVDDHPMVRVGLRTMLERFTTIEVVGEASNVAEAVALTGQVQPDIVLLDVRLGAESGFTACRSIRKLHRQTRVIILTSYSDENAIFDAMAAGADAYLLKEIGGDALVQAIEGVANGQSILDPAVTKVLSRVSGPGEAIGRANLDRLSPQEKRILALVAEGKTNKEIAGIMGLSDKTVKNYFSHILDRLGLSRRSHAAAFYIRHQYS